MYIAEAKIKLEQLKLENNNKDVEAHMVKADALLIQIGMPYREHNHLTNEARADALFHTLPSWLVIKIKESPPPCHHSQWCFGRVAEAARRILTTRASVPSQFKEKEPKRTLPLPTRETIPTRRNLGTRTTKTKLSIRSQTQRRELRRPSRRY